MQHAGVELEHVVDVHSHKVLCQVPLEIDRNRRILQVHNKLSLLAVKCQCATDGKECHSVP